MFETLNWDDLRLFLAVARAGGLAPAADASKTSPPTLNRRMTALEKSLGVTLFARHRAGYDLTEAGKELLALADKVEQGSLAIERWRMAIDPRPTVKIAAGAWTSTFLASHLPEITGQDGAPAIELLSGPVPVDLLRREANLGIRNRRPDTLGLAGRKLARVAFAAYGATPAPDPRPEIAAQDWIAFTPNQATPPSVTWLEMRLHKAPSLRCSSTHSLLEAAKAGAGLCVLPCFIGDPEPALTRRSALIEELGHDQWLVSHDEDRHDKAVREVAAWLAALMRSHKALFAGERPRHKTG